MKISDYLQDELILFSDSATREDVLKELVAAAQKAGMVHDPDQFYRALIEREKIVSTGIGMGVAIPHAKLSSFDHFFIAIAITKKGVEWNSLDGAPVRLVFMIGGPDNKQTEYLQILSALTQLIKDEEIRKKMLTGNSSQGMMSLFKEL